MLGSVSEFGAIAPTSMPSSRPTPATDIATLGWASLLQESLRMTALMIRSTGPVGPLERGGAEWRGAAAGRGGAPARREGTARLTGTARLAGTVRLGQTRPGQSYRRALVEPG